MMITLRRIERSLTAKGYRPLLCELLAGRAEDVPAVLTGLSSPAAAEAMAIIRLDELGRGNAPLVTELIQLLIRRQQADGGWGDAMTTAVCLRALLCWKGSGLAVDRGMAYLGHLQQSDGAFAKEPLRRMPADALTTAFVVLQLNQQGGHGNGPNLPEAARWLVGQAGLLPPDAKRIWSAASARRGRWQSDPHPSSPRSLAAA